MRYSQCVIVLLFIVSLLPVHSQNIVNEQDGQRADSRERALEFSIAYTDSNKYRIESNNRQDIYLNGILEQSDIRINNNILLNILSRNRDSITVAGSAELLEQGQLLSEKGYQYTIDSQGFMNSKNIAEIPFIIDVPVFPLEAVTPGTSWTNSSTEVLTLPRLDSELRVPVQIQYTFWGYDTIAELELDSSFLYSVILIEYAINDYHHTNVDTAGQSTMIILNASFSIFMWWNYEKMRPEYYLEQYKINFNYNGYEDIRFEGETSSRVYPIFEDLTDDFVEDIRESFTDESKPALQRNEKGLTLTFSHINFHPDSTKPLEPLGTQLDPLIDVLIEMKPRRMLIEGHTANVGSFEMKKRLSVERSKVIRNYLQSKLLWDSRYFLYRGHGSEKPLASNRNEEGRKKNRRVEITILEN